MADAGGTAWWAMVMGLGLALVAGCAQGTLDPEMGSTPGPGTPGADGGTFCACASGSCCDGCNLLPATVVCGSQAVESEGSCSADECGADARVRQRIAHCDGVRAECDPGHLQWTDWQVDEDCDASSLCETDGVDAWCRSCGAGCSDGQCECAQGANVAPQATPSLNRGSASPAVYGPQMMNDGAFEDGCGFAWFYDASPDVGWIQLEWATPLDLWGFSIDTVNASSAPCQYTSQRTLSAGTVQWWDGASWVTDGNVAGRTDDWSYTFSQPITTTRIRIDQATGSPLGNPVVFEWQAFACGP